MSIREEYQIGDGDKVQNGEPMPSKDWLIEDRLCKTSFPDCSECPVDTRIMCKYHEDRNYERVNYDNQRYRDGYRHPDSYWHTK